MAKDGIPAHALVQGGGRKSRTAYARSHAAGQQIAEYAEDPGDAGVLYERVMGIEPTLSAWKAEILPLNYTRVYVHVLTARIIVKKKIPGRPGGIGPGRRGLLGPAWCSFFY